MSTKNLQTVSYLSLYFAAFFSFMFFAFLLTGVYFKALAGIVPGLIIAGLLMSVFFTVAYIGFDLINVREWNESRNYTN